MQKVSESWRGSRIILATMQIFMSLNPSWRRQMEKNYSISKSSQLSGNILLISRTISVSVVSIFWPNLKMDLTGICLIVLGGLSSWPRNLSCSKLVKWSIAKYSLPSSTPKSSKKEAIFWLSSSMWTDYQKEYTSKSFHR